MMKEEDIKMMETKNTVTPKLVVKPKSMFLTALHVLTVVIAIVVHPPIQFSVVRVLP